jgi:hypothetical protein
LICEGETAVATRFEGAVGAAAQESLIGKVIEMRKALQKMMGQRMR